MKVSFSDEVKGQKHDTSDGGAYGAEGSLAEEVVHDVAVVAHEILTVADRLHHFFEHKYMLAVLFFLLILDVAIVIASAFLDVLYQETKVDDCIAQMDRCIVTGNGTTLAADVSASCSNRDFGNHTLYDVEHILAYISMGILSLFLIEQGLLWYAKGMEYVKSLHLLDFCVILLSLLLEVLVTKLHTIGGLVIIARVWRFARTGHGALEYSHKSHGLVESFTLHHNGADADALTLKNVWGKLPIERWQALATGLPADRIAPEEKDLAKTLDELPVEVLLQVIARDYAARQKIKNPDECSIVIPGTIAS